MTLGRLISVLETWPRDHKVRLGFARPHSHRGDYRDLAFEPEIDTTVGKMLDAAREAEGATFEGWKGGDFTMRSRTSVYLAHRGRVGEEISGMGLAWMLTAEAIPSFVAERWLP